MIFRSVVFTAMAATGAAFIPGDIAANSAIGQKIMSKARGLENNQRDTSWMANYDIKYLGCSSLIQVGGERQGGGGGQNNNNQGSVLYVQNLVKFGLCKTDEACSSCTGDATYVVNMMDFVDAYTEQKMNTLEYECETIRENCYCNNNGNGNNNNNNNNNNNYYNANGYTCEQQCYVDAGMSDCLAIADGGGVEK